MRRRIRWRWWGKWGTTLAAVLVGSLWVASARWRFELAFWPGPYLFKSRAQGGYLFSFVEYQAGIRWDLARHVWVGRLSAPEWRWWYFLAAFGRDPERSVAALAFPLWLPAALFASLGCFLWYLDRRRPRPGACARCGYDLAGVAGGVCPECGAGMKTKA